MKNKLKRAGRFLKENAGVLTAAGFYAATHVIAYRAGVNRGLYRRRVKFAGISGEDLHIHFRDGTCQVLKEGGPS